MMAHPTMDDTQWEMPPPLLTEPGKFRRNSRWVREMRQLIILKKIIIGGKRGMDDTCAKENI